MKKLCLAVLLLIISLSATAGLAMPVASSARSLVPSELQQLIGVDYRALKDSPTAMALKQQVLPENIKEAETDMKAIGIDAERDLDQLDVASFRTEKKGIQTIYVASGSFSAKAVLKKLKLKKVAATKYGTASLYPMGAMVMTFLDDNTMAFGPEDSLHSALDTRDGKRLALDANSEMTDQMTAVDSSPLWSILDQKGTQAIMMSAMGDAASKVGDYEGIKKRILASHYTMSFQSGVNFDMTVQTADSMTAATLSTVLKGVMLYKKMSASPIEKSAYDSATVDSDSSNLQVHFKSDDQKFQSLMKSPLFAAVSR